MNIAVNTRLLIQGKLEGIGRFTHETLSRITSLMPEHQFHFFFDRPYAEEFIYADNVSGHSIFPPARHPILYNLWFHHALPRAMKRHDIDLLFSPEGYLPLDSSVPAINVMHDINFEHHPDLVPPKHSRHFRKYFPKYAHVAKELITVSEFSKEDIAKTYGIEKGKISVVYNGVSEVFQALEKSAQIELRAELTDGSPYFVFIGSIHPRKNLVRLLKAFDHFKKSKSSDHKLVIVGNKAFMNENLERAYNDMEHRHDVIFTGRLEQKEMIATLASAQSMVFIPIYEGFGIPIIEAFKCNVPVITSDATALPEIAGEAALLVDPYSVESISKGLATIAEDEALRTQLSQSGMNRANEFTWDKAAQAIIEILNRNLGQA